MNDMQPRLPQIRPLAALAFGITLLTAVVLVWGHFHSGDSKGYVTAKVERGDIEDMVSALGTLQPLEFVDVGTQVTGQLKTLHVRVGQAVHKGDLIAEIDPTLFASRAGMTRASVKNARALAAEKQVQLRLAQEVYDRNNGLFADQAVSEELLQQSKAAVEQAAAQLDALNAQAEMYQAELMGDQANLRYTRIYAPMSGTVVSLTAREGQTLVASQQAPIILRIADLSTMTVWAQVSEADVPRIDLHKPVFFSPIGLPGKRWHGEVRQILPTPESVNSVILYDVLFDVPNRQQLLKPQMSAQVSFVIARAEDVLVAPVAALHTAHQKHDDERPIKPVALKEHKHKKDKPTTDEPEDLGPPGGKRYAVRVLTRGGELEEREVAVGVMSRTRAEILSGLEEGEEVVVGAPEEPGKKNKAAAASGAKKS